MVDSRVLTLVKALSWRVVDADGGISFSADKPEPAEEWRERLAGYGKDVHVEKWEQRYYVSESEWTRID